MGREGERADSGLPYLLFVLFYVLAVLAILGVAFTMRRSHAAPAALSLTDRDETASSAFLG